MTHNPSQSGDSDAWEAWTRDVLARGATPPESVEQRADQPDPQAIPPLNPHYLAIGIDLQGILGAATSPSLPPTTPLASTSRVVVQLHHQSASHLVTPHPAAMTDYRLFVPGHHEYVRGRAYLHAAMEALRQYALKLFGFYDDVEMRYSLYALPSLVVASHAQRLSAVEFGRAFGSWLIDVSAAPTVARALATYRAHPEVTTEAAFNLVLLRTPTSGTHAPQENLYGVADMVDYAQALLHESYRTPDHDSNPLS